MYFEGGYGKKTGKYFLKLILRENQHPGGGGPLPSAKG